MAAFTTARILLNHHAARARRRSRRASRVPRGAPFKPSSSCWSFVLFVIVVIICLSFYGHQPSGRGRTKTVRAKRFLKNVFGVRIGEIYAPKPDWTDAGNSPKVAVVPNPSKSTALSLSPKAAVPFEEALQKLETIVEAMESGDLPLESLIARYEEGVKLARVCQEKLAEAELKIQQLEKTATGELKLKPLTADLSEE